jgi:hypothetical protein
MFGIARVAKALTLHSSAHPARTPRATPDGSPLQALARLAWDQVATLPAAAVGVGVGVQDLVRALSERTLAIPAHRRRAPSPLFTFRVMARLVRAEGESREAYLSLLTAAADTASADRVHPAFSDVLGQLDRDELRVLRTLDHEGPFPVVSVSSRLQHGGGSRVELRQFSLLGERASCRHPERTPAYLDNLARLGIVEIRPTRVTDDVRMFGELESHPTVMAARAEIEQRPPVRVGPLSETIVADVNYKSLFLTSFGQQFRDICFHRPDGVVATTAAARDERLAAR